MDLLRTMGSDVVIANTNEPLESPNFVFTIAKRLMETIPNALIPDQVELESSYDLSLSNRATSFQVTPFFTSSRYQCFV